MPEGFWLSDMQWKRLAPLLPNKPRGVARVDDRRVISSIVVPYSRAGAGSTCLPSMDRARRCTIASCAGRPRARGRRCSKPLLRLTVRLPRCCSTAHTSKRTAVRPVERRLQSPGDRRQPRRAHDQNPRPERWPTTPARVPDDRAPGSGLRAADTLLRNLGPSTLAMADRAYDTNAMRQQVEDQGAVPNIPSKRTKRWKAAPAHSLS